MLGIEWRYLDIDKSIDKTKLNLLETERPQQFLGPAFASAILSRLMTLAEPNGWKERSSANNPFLCRVLAFVETRSFPFSFVSFHEPFFIFVFTFFCLHIFSSFYLFSPCFPFHSILRAFRWCAHQASSVHCLRHAADMLKQFETFHNMQLHQASWCFWSWSQTLSWRASLRYMSIAAWLHLSLCRYKNAHRKERWKLHEKCTQSQIPMMWWPGCGTFEVSSTLLRIIPSTVLTILDY